MELESRAGRQSTAPAAVVHAQHGFCCSHKALNLEVGDGCAQDAMGEFPGLQYCKTDLMLDKGVVFCKYGRSSQALAAMEAINTLGMVGARSQCAIKLSAKQRNIHTHGRVCLVHLLKIWVR